MSGGIFSYNERVAKGGAVRGVSDQSFDR